MKNKCHVVFGTFAKSRVLGCKVLQIPKEHIIDLNDDLRIGPINKLNIEKGRLNRTHWFLSNINCDALAPSRSKDSDKIECIKRMSPDTEIYIWSGNNSLDILLTAELLYELKGFNLNIFTLDFSKIKLERRDGTFYNLDSISVALTEHIPIIADSFKPISRAQEKTCLSIWSRVVAENKMMRVLRHNGKIESVNENYFDEVLKKRCKINFKKAARVIGETLVDINFDADDSTLNWRLKQLVLSKQLKAQGDLENIRDYSVKL